MKLVPLYDRVIVEPFEEETKSSGVFYKVAQQ